MHRHGVRSADLLGTNWLVEALTAPEGTLGFRQPILLETARTVINGLAYKLRVDTTGEVILVEHLREYYPVLHDAVAAGDPNAAELAIETIHMLDRRTRPVPDGRPAGQCRPRRKQP